MTIAADILAAGRQEQRDRRKLNAEIDQACATAVAAAAGLSPSSSDESIVAVLAPLAKAPRDDAPSGNRIVGVLCEVADRTTISITAVEAAYESLRDD